MGKALGHLYDAAGYLAAFFIAGIFAVMIAQTVMRQVGLPTTGMDNLTEWFSAAAAFLALAHTFRHGDFVRVTLLIDRLGPRTRRLQEIATLAVGSVFCAYLAFWATRSVYESWLYGQMSGGVIVVPMWIPQISFVVGAILLALAMAQELVRVATGARPRYVTAAEERHARGDYSEDM